MPIASSGGLDPPSPKEPPPPPLGMHQKGRALRSGPRGGSTGGWRRSPKRFGPVTAGTNAVEAGTWRQWDSERLMGAAACRGRGFEGRARVSGEGLIGAAGRRQQHNWASCQASPPPPPKSGALFPRFTAGTCWVGGGVCVWRLLPSRPLRGGAATRRTGGHGRGVLKGGEASAFSSPGRCCA